MPPTLRNCSIPLGYALRATNKEFRSAWTPGAPGPLCGIQRKIGIPAAHLFAEMIRDQLAVEAAIFDEYFAGPRASDNHSRDVHSGDIRFQSLWVAHGTKLFVGKFDSHAPQKIVVGMVSGERENKIIFQAHRSRWS